MTMKHTVAHVLVLAVLLRSAVAGIVAVDLQPGPTGNEFSAHHSGAGVLSDGAVITWNTVAPPVDGYSSSWGSGGEFALDGQYTSAPLVDAEGNTTRVTVSIARGSPRGTTFAVNPSNTWAYDHVATDAKNLMSDYLIAPGGGTNTIVIDHLVADAVYTLCLYGAGDQATHQTTFAVDGVSRATTGAPNDTHVMTEGGDYVVFKEVVAREGRIVIAYTGAGTSRDGNFNGFELKGDLAPGATEGARP